MNQSKSFSLITVLFIVIGFTELAHGYYNPETGSFLSRDPIEERGGENLYGFVRNDAVDKIDFSGLSVQLLVVYDSKYLPDAGRKEGIEANIKSSNEIATSFKQKISNMSDEKFNEITKNGIRVFWWLADDGQKMQNAKETVLNGIKKVDLIKWIEYEEKSVAKFVHESKELRIEDLQKEASRLKGNADYEYESFGLLIHGLANKGVRLSEGNRDTHENAQKIVDQAVSFMGKTLISCGAPPTKQWRKQEFQTFWPQEWDDFDKCKPSITPAQIGYVIGEDEH